MKMRHFTTTILLLTLSLITKAQKDSFWIRNLNLMGEPKAVFALDDGYSIVLADSFDQISKQYKGIIFFKLDANGKTVKRKQLFKLDTAHLEQRLEKAERLDDSYLFRWYFTYHTKDSLVRSKSFFAKIDSNGEVIQNVETVVNYFGQWKSYWWLVDSDLILDIPLLYENKILRYSSIKTGNPVDSVIRKSIYNLTIRNKIIYSIQWLNVEDKYDSVSIIEYDLELDELSRNSKVFAKEKSMQFNHHRIVNDGLVFLNYNRNLVKTDTNLNILWQTPPEFIKAVEEEITDVHILNNDDILVIGNTQMANGEYTPYFTCISGDGQRRKFQYTLPTYVTNYHNFSEGPNGELYFLVSNSNKTYIAKLSPWGQLNYIRENTNVIEIQVYPNPASEKINVKFSRQISGQISIISMNGSEMLTLKIENKRNIKIDLSSILSGSYYIIITPSDGTLYSKMLLKP